MSNVVSFKKDGINASQFIELESKIDLIDKKILSLVYKIDFCNKEISKINNKLNSLDPVLNAAIWLHSNLNFIGRTLFGRLFSVVLNR